MKKQPGQALVINAAAQFNARRELAEVDAGTNELRLMEGALEYEPHAYGAYVRGTHPRLAELLKPETLNNMQVHIADGEDGEGDVAQVYRSSRRVRTARHVTSYLDIPTATLGELADHLKPLYFDPLFSARTSESSEARQHLWVSSAVMAGWMALANWTFDEMDPRADRRYRYGSSAHMQLALMAGCQDDEYFNASVDKDGPTAEATALETAIDETMTVLKFRLMGHMAFKGLVQHRVRSNRDGLATESEIEIFQKMFGREFASACAREPEAATAISFALAYPLDDAETTSLVRTMRSF